MAESGGRRSGDWRGGDEPRERDGASLRIGLAVSGQSMDTGCVERDRQPGWDKERIGQKRNPLRRPCSDPPHIVNTSVLTEDIVIAASTQQTHTHEDGNHRRARQSGQNGLLVLCVHPRRNEGGERMCRQD